MHCLHKWGPIKVRRDWQQPCISSHVILSLWYHYDEKVIGFQANMIYTSFSLRVLNPKKCDLRVHVCHFFFQLYMCKREGFSRVRKSSLSLFASPPINCARNSNEEEAEFFSGGIMSMCFTAAVHWQRCQARAVIELTDWPLQDKHSHSTASIQWGEKEKKNKKKNKKTQRCNLSLRKE